MPINRTGLPHAAASTSPDRRGVDVPGAGQPTTARSAAGTNRAGRALRQTFPNPARSSARNRASIGAKKHGAARLNFAGDGAGCP